MEEIKWPQNINVKSGAYYVFYFVDTMCYSTRANGIKDNVTGCVYYIYINSDIYLSAWIQVISATES